MGCWRSGSTFNFKGKIKKNIEQRLKLIECEINQNLNIQEQWELRDGKSSSGDSLNNSEKNQKYSCDPLLIAEAVWGIDYLLETYPPRWFHKNKKFLFEICKPTELDKEGEIKIKRFLENSCPEFFSLSKIDQELGNYKYLPNEPLDEAWFRANRSFWGSEHQSFPESQISKVKAPRNKSMFAGLDGDSIVDRMAGFCGGGGSR